MSAKKPAASKEPRVNKSDFIREALKELGVDAAPKQVIGRLKERGIHVSPAQVSNVKAMLKRSSGAGRGRAGGGTRISIDDLVEAKKFAERIGGISAAIRALEALARLR